MKKFFESVSRLIPLEMDKLAAQLNNTAEQAIRDREELEQYRKTGLSPDQITTMQAENRALRFDQNEDMAPLPQISNDTPSLEDYWDEK